MFVFLVIVNMSILNYASGLEDRSLALDILTNTQGKWMVALTISCVVFVVVFACSLVNSLRPSSKGRIINQLEVRSAINNKTVESDKFFERYKATQEEFDKSNRDIDAANDLKEKLSYIIGATPTCSMIEWGILAEEGKIPPRWRFKDAYNTPLVWANVADKWGYSDEEKITECWVKFLKWYDKELEKNGMGYPLLYAEYKGDKYDDGKLKFHAEDAKSIQECGENCTMPIAVFWEPVVRECSWKTLGGKISYWEFKYEENN